MLKIKDIPKDGKDHNRLVIRKEKNILEKRERNQR